jgi:hypothetical protein
MKKSVVPGTLLTLFFGGQNICKNSHAVSSLSYNFFDFDREKSQK